MDFKTPGNTCLCRSCGNYFTGIAGFDTHRTGSHARDTRSCLDPATLEHGPDHKRAGKLVFRDAGRAYPCWAFDQDDTRFEQ